MSIGELELWVNNMVGSHFYRAEMKAILKEKQRNVEKLMEAGFEEMRK